MIVIKQKRIHRIDLIANPHVLYLFGDNVLRTGLGGQAQAMRGEKNALGIPVKKKPSMDSDAFFTDSEFEENKRHIIDAFSQIPIMQEVVVVPLDGIGTGRAQLIMRAPRTFEFLQSMLRGLEG